MKVAWDTVHGNFMITISWLLLSTAEFLRLCGITCRDLLGDPEVAELVLLGGVLILLGYKHVGLIFLVSHFGSS